MVKTMMVGNEKSEVSSTSGWSNCICRKTYLFVLEYINKIQEHIVDDECPPKYHINEHANTRAPHQTQKQFLLSAHFLNLKL